MPLFSSKKKAQGRITRDKTTTNRLRRVDLFLLLYAPDLIRKRRGEYKNALFVDVGFGRRPITTLESALTLRRLNPSLPILGIDIDRTLVEEAQSHEDTITYFRHGGFNLPLKTIKGIIAEKVRIIRAFNVLRQYNEEEVVDAHKTLGNYLLPGGIIIEGTSDPPGRFWAANVIRKKPDNTLVREALVFSTNFKSSWSPGAFQPILPKNFIHRIIPGEEIHAFFETWKQEYNTHFSRGVTTQRNLFIKSGRGLKNKGYVVETRKKWLNKGFLIWKQNRVI